MKFDPRDEWSVKTHIIGIVFGIFATIVMIVTQWGTGTGRLVSFTVFGLSMIALYTCSSIYHYYNGPADKLLRLRKLDHSMIYVLIAGTYTPFLYICMPGPGKMIFLAAMWIIAAIGIIIKVFWLDAPRWLYTGMYLLMGWAIVFSPSTFANMSSSALFWLVAGGISYSIGAVCYIIKKPNLFAGFGFHEVFHVFILLGTLCHFISVEFFI